MRTLLMVMVLIPSLGKSIQQSACCATNGMIHFRENLEITMI